MANTVFEHGDNLSLGKQGDATHLKSGDVGLNLARGSLRVRNRVDPGLLVYGAAGFRPRSGAAVSRCRSRKQACTKEHRGLSPAGDEQVDMGTLLARIAFMKSIDIRSACRSKKSTLAGQHQSSD